jgi:hypothetical protein
MEADWSNRVEARGKDMRGRRTEGREGGDRGKGKKIQEK